MREGCCGEERKPKCLAGFKKEGAEGAMDGEEEEEKKDEKKK